jgi:hypothetical protein
MSMPRWEMTNASIFSLPFQVQGRSCHTVSATNREFPAITVSAYDPAVPAAFSGALSTGRGNGIERWLVSPARICLMLMLRHVPSTSTLPT